MDVVIQGFASVLSSPFIIFLILIGTAIGIIFGSIPGLTATMAIVMFLPMTYTMEPIEGISILMALYIGGISGGLISAILLKIPGTPSSIATCFDGAPMADKGEAGKALGTGIVFSFIGTIFGVVALALIAPVLADIAIKFGAYEYCMLVIFSLSLVAALIGKDILKGLISAVLGGIVSTVGLSPIDSRLRYTFGMMDLTSGFKLLVFLIGIFAITEVVKYAEDIRKPEDLDIRSNVTIKGFGFTMPEFLAQKWNALRSALIGVVIGILPGIGGGVSCMLSYTVAKNNSKHPEKFGTGIMDGIVASETANNGTIGGAMIPLLSLGIPGDAVTAMLLGGLMVHNVAPGPLIFQKSGVVVYGIFAAMLVSNLFMLLLEFFAMRGFIKLLKIPKYLMFPVIIVLCCIGAIGDSNRIFDVWGVLIFGLMGYALIKAGVPMVPMILGFILGPMFEMNLRKSSQLYVMDPYSIFQHPIALLFIAVTIVAMYFSIKAQRREARAAAEAEE